MIKGTLSKVERGLTRISHLRIEITIKFPILIKSIMTGIWMKGINQKETMIMLLTIIKEIIYLQMTMIIIGEALVDRLQTNSEEVNNRISGKFLNFQLSFLKQNIYFRQKHDFQNENTSISRSY